MLSRRTDTSTWCLVGGMMVLVALAERNYRGLRSSQTKDLDLVVDICSSPSALADVVHQLESFGFELAPGGPSGGFARCTFVGIDQQSQIDVLCPNDADTQQLRSVPHVESLAIPGGRRAIEGSQLVAIQFSDDQREVVVRVPLGADSLIVKANAVFDTRTAHQQRHIQDVVELLLCLEDPGSENTRLNSTDFSILTHLAERLDDDHDIAWAEFDASERNRARVALDLLLATE